MAASKELQRYGIEILRLSRLYRTKPYGLIEQPNFTNAAALISTSLPPAALLSRLKKIEVRAGRRSLKRWGPRPLDLDIIDYNNRIINWPNPDKQAQKFYSPKLTLPHPGAARRLFVLLPILEITPSWRHPVYKLNAAQLLRRIHTGCTDEIIDILLDDAAH